MYRCYFIGGPDDLVVRIMEKPPPWFHIPIPPPQDELAELYAPDAPPMPAKYHMLQVGSYERVGPLPRDPNRVVYEWKRERYE